MIILSVPEMMCSNCVKRINTALGSTELKYSVSLDDKTVTIDGGPDCAARAAEKLEEIGFDVTVRQ